jgi:hypothetical protein
VRKDKNGSIREREVGEGGLSSVILLQGFGRGRGKPRRRVGIEGAGYWVKRFEEREVVMGARKVGRGCMKDNG